MSIAMPAIAEAPPAGDAPVSAAELAARIPVPVQLPIRSYDGERIRHLSPSSYNLWATCREAYRRKYICGQREAPSGAMFLGSRVDDAVSLYYRRKLEHGEQLDLDQVKDGYRELWQQGHEQETEKLGVTLLVMIPFSAFGPLIPLKASELNSDCDAVVSATIEESS